MTAVRMAYCLVFGKVRGFKYQPRNRPRWLQFALVILSHSRQVPAQEVPSLRALPLFTKSIIIQATEKVAIRNLRLVNNKANKRKSTCNVRLDE